MILLWHIAHGDAQSFLKAVRPLHMLSTKTAKTAQTSTARRVFIAAAAAVFENAAGAGI